MTAGMQMPNMASPMVPTVDPNQGWLFYYYYYYY